MAILSCVQKVIGAEGVNPREWAILTDDTFATVTTSGYLTDINNTMNFQTTDYAQVYTTDLGTIELAINVAANGTVSLVFNSSGGVITYPVTANRIAVFTSTSSTSTSVGDDAATAVNGGNIQAGLSGTAGYLASFPATAAKGSLKVSASANTGDTDVTITNAQHGQATVYSIPDCGAATGQINVVTGALVDGNLMKATGTAGKLANAGFNIKSAITAVYGGGGTSNVFTATGITTSSIVTASIVTATNIVSIIRVVPGTNTLTIAFSGDPGANTTVSWIATNVAVA
jgi:hypothetical protein